MNQTSQQPSLKEKQSHGTRLFPCAYYHFCNPSHRLRVRHHWHEEVEIVYLHHGSFKLYAAAVSGNYAGKSGKNSLCPGADQS